MTCALCHLLPELEQVGYCAGASKRAIHIYATHTRTSPPFLRLFERLHPSTLCILSGTSSLTFNLQYSLPLETTNILYVVYEEPRAPTWWRGHVWLVRYIVWYLNRLRRTRLPQDLWDLIQSYH